MSQRSEKNRPVLGAVLASVAIVAVIGGVGAVAFRSAPVNASIAATGITPVEASLGVAPKPVTLSTIAVKSTGGLHIRVATPARAFKSAGTSVALVTLKALPKPKPRPAPKKPPAARQAVQVASSSSSGGDSGGSSGSSSGGGSSGPVSGGDWNTAQCSTFGIGDGLVGQGMANGDTLRADSMVVAHKTLPFGTRIQFEYNGHTCVATVADRGPYTAGREFDLGPGTAHALGFDGVDYLRWRIVN